LVVDPKENGFTKVQILLGLELPCAVACSEFIEANVPWAEVRAPLVPAVLVSENGHFLYMLSTKVWS